MGPAQLRALGPPRYATRGKLPAEARRDGEKGKTPSIERLMPDPQAIEAERRVQPQFRKWTALAALAAVVLLFGRWVAAMPDRLPLEPRTAIVRFEPVELGSMAP